MDRRTHRAYHRDAHSWTAAREPGAIKDGRLPAFLRRVLRRGRIVDLGCGPGWYATAMREAGFRSYALDVTMPMLAIVGRRTPELPRVCADLVTLPFAPQSLDGAWGLNTYCHLPAGELALALAELHAAMKVGAPLEMTLPRLDWFKPAAAAIRRGDVEHRSSNNELPGRLFTGVSESRARELLEGAGFDRVRIEPWGGDFWLRITARRARTLPDLVRPALRLLICGLNPSVYSADRGVPFARPGNRFWAAAKVARLVEQERDPRAALRLGIGFTDSVKRATPGADALSPREYAKGFERLEALVRRYRPGATCFVGLDGWRRVVDRRAAPGWIEGGFAGRPAYLMPSTSGRNARVPIAELARHLKSAANPERVRRR